MDNPVCLSCHGNEGFAVPGADGKQRDLHVNAGRFEKSKHGALPCIGCHQDITEIPHKQGVQRKVECGNCHADAAKQYSTSVHAANFRLIAATNKDLKGMIGGGTFRDDFYYRINVFPIESPPLRERRDDIPSLAFHFLKQYADELGKKVDEISEGALNVLLNYAWPGNVRELENTINRAVLLTTDKVIRKAHLVSLLDADPSAYLDVPRTSEELKRLKKEARERSVEHLEKAFILEALKRNGWNVTRSAEETGMLRANFQALMKKHAIRIREAEKGDGDASDT